MKVSKQMIRECLLKSSATIRSLLRELPDCFLVLTGLAGKTSSIIVPYVLERAKEQGKRVPVFTWSPLHFEGNLGMERFSSALNRIIHFGDYLFIQNNQLTAMQNRNANLSSLYERLDARIVENIGNLKITDHE
jgi:cell division GTPase FtsZ